jgi:hypothetical protein
VTVGLDAGGALVPAPGGLSFLEWSLAQSSDEVGRRCGDGPVDLLGEGGLHRFETGPNRLLGGSAVVEGGEGGLGPLDLDDGLLVALVGPLQRPAGHLDALGVAVPGLGSLQLIQVLGCPSLPVLSGRQRSSSASLRRRSDGDQRRTGTRLAPRAKLAGTRSSAALVKWPVGWALNTPGDAGARSFLRGSSGEAVAHVLVERNGPVRSGKHRESMVGCGMQFLEGIGR